MRLVLRLCCAIVLAAAATSCASGDDAAEDREPVTTTAVSAPRETTADPPTDSAREPEVVEYDVPEGSRPHDVWADDDGIVWYTGQRRGVLGRLDPATGEVTEIDLGDGSAPHGVIVGPDGAPWVTDGGLNAIVRVDPATSDVEVYPLPPTHPEANLNTAVFDPSGTLWFTGRDGMYGRVTRGGEVEAFDAPRGRGPYGITVTPAGDVYYASLAGSYMGRIDPDTGVATVLEPPTADQGTRRVWADSRGRVWSSQWDAGQVAVYDPATDDWREWRLPGDEPAAYAIWVDAGDRVWLSDFGANAIFRFDSDTEEFTSFPLPSDPGEVRQLHGRDGEVWGAESAADKLVVVRT